ncbi:MAG: hypothetical protein SF052_27395 [Bacteroidia bacterium]|nr:hypothetical protein [Bacteroidia bacterium]
MSNYKINIDKPLPDSETINRHKNFDGVYDQYQVTKRFEFWRNLYRKPTYFAAVAAAIAIIFLVFDTVDEEIRPEKIIPKLAPLTASDPDVMILNINAEKAFSFESSTCSKVQIPAHAFTGPDDEPVSGQVEIRYRELRNESTAEANSLGVVEILCSQKGYALKLRKNAFIDVSFFSEDTTSGYNVFALNETRDNWAAAGATEVLLADATPRGISKPERPASTYILDQVNDQLIAKSITPILPKPGKPFEVKISNHRDFPEFRNTGKTYWEYLEKPGSVNPWEEGLLGENIAGYEVKARKTSAREYELRFTQTDASGQILTQIVFATPMAEVNTPEEAEALYRQNYRAWENSREELRQQAEARRREQEKIAAAEREYQIYQQKLREWEASVATTDTVSRTQGCFHKFSVTHTGAFNLAKEIP